MTANDRQFLHRTAGRHVTNSLTPWLAALALGLACTLPDSAAGAQEPVIEASGDEPEVAVENDPVPEAIVEQEGDEPAATSASRSSSAVVDPPGRVARLGYVNGDVTVAPAGTEEWADAVINRPLTSGDRVWVEEHGRAELQVGSSVVYLDGDTGFGLIELDDHLLQASLTEGTATLRVRRLAEGETLQVETPHATVFLDRVGEYHLEVDKASDRTIVKARSGEARVEGGGKTYTVRANERGEFTGLEKLTARIEPIGPRTAFENWANDRDARNERSKSAQYVSRDVIGYEDLDDNGDWISEPEYGYVWRPRYVAYDWAPYRYGRWVYVSPWGWSWIDDAPWGFAVTHYGRWAYLRERWCWVPGPRRIRPIYAPALVGWIGGPSVGVSISFGSGIGWYPLGPRDVFYPGYRHTPRYGRYVNVSNTIIVNNYYGGRYRREPQFDYRRYPHAVTAVARDRFLGGQPIGGHWLRMDEGNLRSWRAEHDPPAIAPYRESVLAGQVRQPPRDLGRFRGGREGDVFAGRVPFHDERRAIESNGGRPIGMTELRDRNRNPKRSGDFINSRRDMGNRDNLRESDRERWPNGGPAPRSLNNDSIREWPLRRDSERNAGSVPRAGSRDSSPRTIQRDQDAARERLHIMRGEESREEGRRRDHMASPPGDRGFQPGNSGGLSRPPSDRVRESERGAIGRGEQRGFRVPRNEPHPGSAPASRPEPRSQPQPGGSAEPSAPRSHQNNEGRGNRGPRPMEGPRER